MKSNDVTRRPLDLAPGIVQAPTPPEQKPALLPAPPQVLVPSSQTVVGGLAHTAPTFEAQQTQPAKNAIAVLSDQKEVPHRRGRTAALRVRDVREDFGVSQRKAFKPLVDLIAPLHELVAQFRSKA